MASVCRSVLTATGSRSMAGRTRTLLRKTLNPMPDSSSSKGLTSVSRIVSSLATVESLMPLHSAVASARLKSKIAVDSHCWSWLSEGFATPL
ncbi:protein NUCLEAR FUSION DEFECTIVE 6, chloroplastic/mitochondrial [Cucurbita pepo subsp. pepo]|uniref:protein NUCLEAR FUSION DEFECTIVE 6, chloroplastic/mitochondrial n=1 Tax=Cucurbita pepo subsp. pepo TaxID=3664 RepID=UPI000C9D4F6A|nr:protein NUCLEAR FUSION DEFECTIVE 6, chloroplastic/mitochondrial [Cucurbita pepo subsp. pepo]